jgi:hypothetical protein
MRIYDRYVKALMLDHYEIQHDRVVVLADLAQNLAATNEASTIFGEIYATTIRSHGKI